MQYVVAPVCQRVVLPNGRRFYYASANPNYYEALADGDWPTNGIMQSTVPNGAPMTQIWGEWNENASLSGAINSINGEFNGVIYNGEFQVYEYAGYNLFAVLNNNQQELPYWADVQSFYDPNSQNLLQQTHIIQNNLPVGSMGDLSGYRQLQPTTSPDSYRWVTEQTTYNFAGNPLSKTATEESCYPTSYSPTISRVATIGYAYWDSSKYYQQKSTQDENGRYSYTDYYPNTAALGSRGEKFEIFDPAHGGFTTGGPTPPSYDNSSQDAWRYNVIPTAAQYSAQFLYDGVGRCTDVYKLQSTTTSPWTYVHTQTSYGANTDGSWGQAHQVVEDVGGIGRTTVTNAYTAWGKPCDVTDAKGHEFVTSFDLDGNIQTVAETDCSPNLTIASYTYGPVGTASGPTGTIATGVPISITDGVSGVTDSISYEPTGMGIGQVASTTETNGSSSYTVSYNYNSQGDRWQTTYQTAQGIKIWQYDDYETVGPVDKEKRVFQTLTLLQNGQLSPEQMQYAYDTSGAVRETAFAQTPEVGFTPAAGNPWYDSSDLASVRARTYYAYDPAGRMLSDQTYWDTWNSSNSTYSSTPVLDNECAYETATGYQSGTTISSSSNRGLKTQSQFLYGSGGSWQIDHTEGYSYDPSLDYLTGANYGDGQPNATPSWTYDAAGNRNDTVADNLNRPLSISGVTCTFRRKTNTHSD
jgi:hypothetical protein